MISHIPACPIKMISHIPACPIKMISLAATAPLPAPLARCTEIPARHAQQSGCCIRLGLWPGPGRPPVGLVAREYANLTGGAVHQATLPSCPLAATGSLPFRKHLPPLSQAGACGSCAGRRWRPRCGRHRPLLDVHVEPVLRVDGRTRGHLDLLARPRQRKVKAPQHDRQRGDGFHERKLVADALARPATERHVAVVRVLFVGHRAVHRKSLRVEALRLVPHRLAVVDVVHADHHVLALDDGVAAGKLVCHERSAQQHRRVGPWRVAVRQHCVDLRLRLGHAIRVLRGGARQVGAWRRGRKQVLRRSGDET
eukprot:363566-Chlamydomonas_euryale.AAC.3